MPKKIMTQAKLNHALNRSSQILFGKPYKDLTEDERDIAEESISEFTEESILEFTELVFKELKKTCVKLKGHNSVIVSQTKLAGSNQQSFREIQDVRRTRIISGRHADLPLTNSAWRRYHNHVRQRSPS